MKSTDCTPVTCSIQELAFWITLKLAPKSTNGEVSPTQIMVMATCFLSKNFSLLLAPTTQKSASPTNQNNQNYFIINDNFNNQKIITFFSRCSLLPLPISSVFFNAFGACDPPTLSQPPHNIINIVSSHLRYLFWSEGEKRTFLFGLWATIFDFW